MPCALYGYDLPTFYIIILISQMRILRHRDSGWKVGKRGWSFPCGGTEAWWWCHLLSLTGLMSAALVLKLFSRKFGCDWRLIIHLEMSCLLGLKTCRSSTFFTIVVKCQSATPSHRPHTGGLGASFFSVLVSTKAPKQPKPTIKSGVAFLFTPLWCQEPSEVAFSFVVIFGLFL